MSAGPAAARLQQALQANHDLAEQIQQEDFPLAELERLQAFQRERLSATYDDLWQNPRYRAAVTFFLGELYGGLHFMERDQQVQRALPLLTRMLPANMQSTLADAFRLQDLSLSLDIRLLERWRESGQPALNEEVYAQLYPVVPRQDRQEQIRLIYDLGLELNQLVRHKLVLMLVKAMKRPARAAGFAALQSFLEEGFSAFAAIGDSRGFVTTIRDRETRIMQALYDGQARPFDWQG